MSIKDTLKKNEVLHYLGICIGKIRDSGFRKLVINLPTSPDVLYFKHLGEKNSDKNIYLIYLNNDARGFFSQFNLVMDCLYYSEYYHLTPVVEFGSETLYNEPDGLDGQYNSFEYYFKQPCGISVQEAHGSKNVIFSESKHRRSAVSDFSYTLSYSLSEPEKMDSYITSHAELIRKYIHFSDRIQKYLDETVTPLFNGEKVLGVHVRGTDFNAGYNGHAVAVTPVEYLEETKSAFKAENFDKVFLATDEASVIDLYKKEFGDKIIYFSDTLHSENGTALHFSENGRKNHKYLLGAEVLRDMYTLSMCDGLIAGYSNVSLASRMFKCARDESYAYLKLVDKGFYNSKKRMKK